MAGNAERVLLLLWAGCATTLPARAGDVPEIVDFKAHWPAFYETARARLDRDFHGREVAERSQLGAGRWRAVVRIDLDVLGDNHGCQLLRSSGFNAIDDEAVAACRRVKDLLFPPEGVVDEDRYAHVPVELVVERP
jgi:TonB family protein